MHCNLYLVLLVSYLLVPRWSSANNCNGMDLATIRELRVEHLRNSIMAQLGLNEVPTPPVPYPVDDSELDPEVLNSYYQIVNATYAPEKCTTDDFYAKPIHSFVGQLSEGIVARSRRSLADQPWNIIDDSDNDDSDGAAESSVEEEGILSKYTITLDFELPVEQQEISRASLLLQQVQTDTFNNAVLDVNQVVEIRTVINNVRYFVEKKEVDVYAAGSQSFDITRAAELWVEEEVSGQVLLEVLVRCYSSPNCTEVTPSGKKPAVVSFFHNTTDTSKLPRIITISKNPLEGGKEWRRKKREEEEEVPTVTEPVFCAENDTSGFCCLHPLILRFDEDLNMPFVSKPKSFEANFCDGYCPEVSAIGVGTIRRYELLQALSARPTNSIEPCCTGLEYKPLQVVLSIWNYMTGKFTSRQDRLAQVEVVKCRCG